MSSYYGVIFSRFWTGETGRALRLQGGKDAQLLGVYLFSNDYMNMLGLYPLKVRDIRDDLDLSPAQITKAFGVMAKVGYADFDLATSVVWVREMATFRLSLKDRDPLKPADKRVIGAQRLYSRLPANPFLSEFFDRYGKILRLKTRREGPPQDVGAKVESLGLPRALRRGPEGPLEASKQNQDQDQSTGSEYRKSSAADASPPPSRPVEPVENPQANYPVIEKLAHLSIDVLGLSNVGDLVEDVKHRCAEQHIAYTSTIVSGAVDSAIVQRHRKASRAR